MRAWIIGTILITLFSACVATKVVSNKTENPFLGKVKTISVGDVFYENVNCYGEDNGAGYVYKGECSKYDLTLVGQTDEKITLQYREYMKPVAGPYGGYRMDAPWLVKDGFNRNLDYSIKEPLIRYKNNTFQILELKSGMITYKKVQ